MTFWVGRSGLADLHDYRLLRSPLLKPFSRVLLVVVFNTTPRVLMDGMITNHQFAPGHEPGTSTLTITGEDVGVMMDMEEKIVEYPAQDETVIATKIILNYVQYGLIPNVVPPGAVNPPNPAERPPVQHETDLKYLQDLAGRHGYVFYIEPGPAPFANTAHWRPPERGGTPQPALSFNQGPNTNIESIKFQYNALAPTLVRGQVPGEPNRPVQTHQSTRAPLVRQPALPGNLPNVRTVLLKDIEGKDYQQVLARAQGITDTSTDAVVTATGELDALRYGHLLQPRRLVGLRGVGYSHDGLYYVKNVTHSIRHGEYKQSFTLTREGLGALTPTVRP